MWSPSLAAAAASEGSFIGLSGPTSSVAAPAGMARQSVGSSQKSNRQQRRGRRTGPDMAAPGQGGTQNTALREPVLRRLSKSRISIPRRSAARDGAPIRPARGRSTAMANASGHGNVAGAWTCSGRMVRITLTRPSDLAAVADRWQALEAAPTPSFFQSWTWVGCLAEERFPDPVLLAAEEDGRTVALALFNRSRRPFVPEALYLGESGAAALDCGVRRTQRSADRAGPRGSAASLLRAAVDAPVAAEVGHGGVAWC